MLKGTGVWESLPILVAPAFTIVGWAYGGNLISRKGSMIGLTIEVIL